MFEYVNDLQQVRRKSSSFLELLKHIFSMTSYLCENAILLGILLESEDSPYFAARWVKNGTSLCKNVCDIILHVTFILRHAAYPPRKECYKVVHSLAGCLLRVVTLMSAFGVILRDRPLLVPLLEIGRYILAINKSLVYC